MKDKQEFEIDFDFLGSFAICCLIMFVAVYFATILGRIDNLNNERDCIDYYLNTGYILEECTNYENLKK